MARYIIDGLYSCPQCQEQKLEEDFYANRTVDRLAKLSVYCKACTSINAKLKRQGLKKPAPLPAPPPLRKPLASYFTRRSLVNSMCKYVESHE